MLPSHATLLLQLLALYLANLARLIKHHGKQYTLEESYANCLLLLMLEGWDALTHFGGPYVFVNVANK